MSKKKKKKSYLQRLMEAQEEMDTNNGKVNSLKDYARISSRNYGDDEADYSNKDSASEETGDKPGSISSYANIMKSKNRK